MKIKCKSKMILIRFSSKEKIEELQNGEISFKKIRNYNKLKDGIIGDEVDDGYYSTGFETANGTPCNLRIVNDYEGSFALCLFGILEHDEKFVFSDKEKMMKLGESALVITDVDEFIERVREEAEKNNYKFEHKEAFYYDENKALPKEDVDEMTKGRERISFFMRKKYAYQQEYRLLIIDEKNQSDKISLTIKEISNISQIIDTKKLLDEGIEFE